MRKMILAAVLSAFAFSASASNPASPIGKWRTMDDETGKPMTVTEIYQAQNGTLAAKIVENLGMPATCTGCSGANKDKPFVGIVILWNLKPTGANTWGGGNGYKPSEDRSFKARSITLVDGGRKLEVKGCVAFFCRTATWIRVE